MKIKSIILLTSLFLSMCSTAEEKKHQASNHNFRQLSDTELQKLGTAYFASGCFWCVEAIFESVRGVKEVVSGYAGGLELNPTYQKVAAGQTNHSETVLVYYEPSEVSYETLIKVYYGSHNPTTVDGQYPDFGTQYRSIIFYQNEEEKEFAEAFKAKLDSSGKYSQPIATEVIPFEKFWIAEEYHQNYERLHPNQSYIQNISIPRLKKFQKKYPDLIKAHE